MIEYFIQLSWLKQLLFAYILLINIISFFYLGLDKLKAQLKRRRISEKTLWILTLIGGSIGSLLGMNYFRHKTKKISFQAGIAVILALQVVLVVWLVI